MMKRAVCMARIAGRFVFGEMLIVIAILLSLAAAGEDALRGVWKRMTSD